MGVPSEGGTSDKLVSLVLDKAGLTRPGQATGRRPHPGTFDLVKRGDIVGYMVSIDPPTRGEPARRSRRFRPRRIVRADAQVYTATQEGLQKSRRPSRNTWPGSRTPRGDRGGQVARRDDRVRAKYSFASLDDDTVAKESLLAMRDLWTAKGKPLLVTVEDYWVEGYEELIDAGMIKSGSDPTNWMDNSLLPASNR